jgi:hypothetical protein
MNITSKLFIIVAFLISNQVSANDVIPEGWVKSGSDINSYKVSVDTDIKASGEQSLSIESIPRSEKSAGKGFGGVAQSSDADDYINQRIQLKVAIKTSNVEGRAAAWLRVNDDSGIKSRVLSMDNMSARPIKGTNDWSEYALVLDVPSTATDIAYGVFLSGKGKMWVDNISIESVDASTPITATFFGNAKPRNLDFEMED